MNLDDFIRDFEQSTVALPRQLVEWRQLPELVRESFFEELIGMLARRGPAERLAISLGRDADAVRLSNLHGQLMVAIAEYGSNAGFSAADFLDSTDIASVTSIRMPLPDDLAPAA